jgi:hypothetical protein
VLVDDIAYASAPRLVATPDGRVLLGTGDRAYVRGPNSLAMPPTPGAAPHYRVLRQAVTLKDPATGAVIGHEAPVVGRAVLVRADSSPVADEAGDPPRQERVTAMVEIEQAFEDIRVGDRLLPETPVAGRTATTDTPEPHGTVQTLPAAPQAVSAQVVSVSGSARTWATQHQVVVINRGRVHGILQGQLLAVLHDSRTIQARDATPQLELPGEPKGRIQVLRSFEHLSYALVLQASDGVKIGDRVTLP